MKTAPRASLHRLAVAACAALLAACASDASTIDAPVPAALAVRVLRAQCEAVSGVTVAFAVTSGSGSVSPASAVTDVDGQASTRLTLVRTR